MECQKTDTKDSTGSETKSVSTVTKADFEMSVNEDSIFKTCSPQKSRKLRPSKECWMLTRSDLLRRFLFLADYIRRTDIGTEIFKRLIDSRLPTRPYFRLNLTSQSNVKEVPKSNSKLPNRLKTATSQTIHIPLSKPNVTRQEIVEPVLKCAVPLDVAGQVLNSLPSQKATEKITNSVSLQEIIEKGLPPLSIMDMNEAAEFFMENTSGFTSFERIPEFAEVGSSQTPTGLMQDDTRPLNHREPFLYVMPSQLRYICKQHFNEDPCNWVITEQPYTGLEPHPKAKFIAHMLMTEILKIYILLLYYDKMGIPYEGAKPPDIEEIKHLLSDNDRFMNVIKQLATYIIISPKVNTKTQPQNNVMQMDQSEFVPINITEETASQVTPKIVHNTKVPSQYGAEKASHTSLFQLLSTESDTSTARMLNSNLLMSKFDESENVFKTKTKNRAAASQRTTPLQEMSFEQMVLINKLKRVVGAHTLENRTLPLQQLKLPLKAAFHTTLAKDIKKCMNPVFAKRPEKNVEVPGDFCFNVMDPLVLYGIRLHKYAKDMRELISVTELAIQANFLPSANAVLPMPKRPEITPRPMLNNFQFMPKNQTQFSMGTEETYPELSTEVVGHILNQNVAAIVGLLGFETTYRSILDVLVDVLIEFYKKVSYRLKIATEDEKRGWLTDFPNVIERVLMEIGMGGCNSAHEFYNDRVVKYVKILEKDCGDLKQEYRNLFNFEPSCIPNVETIEEYIVEAETEEVTIETPPAQIILNEEEEDQIPVDADFYQLLNNLETGNILPTSSNYF